MDWNHELPLNFDAPCLHCRYNLRGLAGERIRGPECGGENERSTLELLRNDETAKAEARGHAGERRRREARVAAHEAGAGLCAIGTGGAIFCGLLRLAMPVFYEDILRPAFAVCATTWVVGLALHRTMLRGRPGCWAALVRHQYYALPLVLLNIFTIVILGVGAAWILMPGGGGTCALLLVLALPFVLWRLRPFRFLSEPARREIARLVPRSDGFDGQENGTGE